MPQLRLYRTNAARQKAYRLRNGLNKGTKKAKPYFLSSSIEWGTPPEIFDPLDAQYHFTLDVCASAANAKVPRYFSAAQNGLAQDWGQEICWMNPPYGRQLETWMRKAYGSAQAGATVVSLVPARTSNRWWHAYAQHAEYTFLKGRVRFVGAASTAPFPSVILIFRPPGVHR
jgi:phage N-6-adenine-methyltransferase